VSCLFSSIGQVDEEIVSCNRHAQSATQDEKEVEVPRPPVSDRVNSANKNSKDQELLKGIPENDKVPLSQQEDSSRRSTSSDCFEKKCDSTTPSKVAQPEALNAASSPVDEASSSLSLSSSLSHDSCLSFLTQRFQWRGNAVRKSIVQLELSSNGSPSTLGEDNSSPASSNVDGTSRTYVPDLAVQLRRSVRVKASHPPKEDTKRGSIGKFELHDGSKVKMVRLHVLDVRPG
jgi:hypothetical protein